MLKILYMTSPTLLARCGFLQATSIACEGLPFLSHTNHYGREIARVLTRRLRVAEDVSKQIDVLLLPKPLAAQVAGPDAGQVEQIGLRFDLCECPLRLDAPAASNRLHFPQAALVTQKCDEPLGSRETAGVFAEAEVGVEMGAVVPGR